MSAVLEPVAAPPLAWRNRFAGLGEAFYTALPAQPIPEPHWVAVSGACTALLGLPADWWQRPDFTIEHFYPECSAAPNPYAALLEAVTRRTAELAAHWQAVGFCHGVMNTDNMSILGLTIDYGPFGFLDAFEPGHICNHSDPDGRYAYDRQPNIALWNLHALALAQALLPLIGEPEAAVAALEPYKAVFPATLVDDFLRLLANDRVDFTIAWRRLAEFPSERVRDLFIDRAAFDAWAERYAEVMRLLKVLERPYDEQPERPACYADFPPDWAQHIEVSCSS